MPVDPHLQGLLDLIDAAPYPPMHEGTPETARKAFRAMTVQAVRPEQVIPIGTVADSEVAGVPVRLYHPSAHGPVPTRRTSRGTWRSSVVRTGSAWRGTVPVATWQPW